MSVLFSFSIFPMDKGESVSPYVTRVIRIIKSSGLQYKMGPMGTTVEGDYDVVMALINDCFKEIKKDCNRIYMNINVDYRRGKTGRIESKIKSIERKL